jgi:hypothetical protein
MKHDLLLWENEKIRYVIIVTWQDDNIMSVITPVCSLWNDPREALHASWSPLDLVP